MMGSVFLYQDVQMFLQYRTESLETKALASLFQWLVQILGSRKPAVHHKGTAAEIETMEKYFPKLVIMKLLRKCLVVCSNGNKHMMNSALALAEMMGNNKLLNDKLAKLLSLKRVSDLDVSEEAVGPPEINSFEKFLSIENESIDAASKSLESIKLQGRTKKSKKLEEAIVDDCAEMKPRWTTAKSWKPCPIGKSAHSLGYCSGSTVVVGCNNDNPQSSKHQEWRQNSGNPEAQGGIEQVKKVTMVKMSEVNENGKEKNGRLLIDGLWKRVKEEELLAIASNVRILV